jgi:hypothetical protein
MQNSTFLTCTEIPFMRHFDSIEGIFGCNLLTKLSTNNTRISLHVFYYSKDKPEKVQILFKWVCLCLIAINMRVFHKGYKKSFVYNLCG